MPVNCVCCWTLFPTTGLTDTHSFQEAITDPTSPRVGWYNFKHWPDEYESFFGVKELPQVNLRHPEAHGSTCWML